MFDPLTLDHLRENLIMLGGYLAVGLTALASSKVKAWMERKRARSAMRRSVDSTRLLNNYLAVLQSQLDCDRITVCQFHNGEHFASGASVQKVSLTHYVMRAGVAMPESPDAGARLDPSPASFMPAMLATLFDHGYCISRDFDAEDPWVARFQAQNGLRTVVTCLVPGRKAGEAFGLVNFSWLDRTEPAPATVKEMTHHARRISTLL